MPPEPYFDANVVLAFVSGEDRRASVVRELLEQADRGTHRIYTSTITIAEVALGAQEKAQRALDAATEARIDRLVAAKWKADRPRRSVHPDHAQGSGTDQVGDGRGEGASAQRTPSTLLTNAFVCCQTRLMVV